MSVFAWRFLVRLFSRRARFLSRRKAQRLRRDQPSLWSKRLFGQRRLSKRLRTAWTPTLPSPKTDGEGNRKFQIDDHRAHPGMLFAFRVKC
jgi:hypothetical protein